MAAQQAHKRARARRRALEGEGEEVGGLLARVAAAEEEEAAAALLGGWEDGGALTRGVDGRIVFVGGLLTEKVWRGRYRLCACVSVDQMRLWPIRITDVHSYMPPSTLQNRPRKSRACGR